MCPPLADHKTTCSKYQYCHVVVYITQHVAIDLVTDLKYKIDLPTLLYAFTALEDPQLAGSLPGVNRELAGDLAVYVRLNMSPLAGDCAGEVI